MFKLTPIALVLFITTTINLAIAYISWQRRKTRRGHLLYDGHDMRDVLDTGCCI
jgi:hypothetical protein